MKKFDRFLDDLNFDEIKINRKIKKVDNKLKIYTCVCFHDVACHIDRDRHEVLSAKRALEKMDMQ